MLDCHVSAPDRLAYPGCRVRVFVVQRRAKAHSLACRRARECDLHTFGGLVFLCLQSTESDEGDTASRRHHSMSPPRPWTVRKKPVSVRLPQIMDTTTASTGSSRSNLKRKQDPEPSEPSVVIDLDLDAEDTSGGKRRMFHRKARAAVTSSSYKHDGNPMTLLANVEIAGGSSLDNDASALSDDDSDAASDCDDVAVPGFLFERTREELASIVRSVDASDLIGFDPSQGTCLPFG
jgi:hypothetical protein